MTKSLLLPVGLLSAVAVMASGCAHQPPAPLSAELTVMQAATDLGYNIPKVVNGQTFYCKQEEATGTMVPKQTCLSSDQVLSEAQAQGDELKYLSQAPNGTPHPPNAVSNTPP
ncbi:MAG: hypothetical protein WAU49_16230 [Steroidobacteraceae bacterium]